MANVIIVIILLVVVTLGIRETVKHFKGEGMQRNLGPSSYIKEAS